MTDTDDIASADLTHRAVLVGLVDLSKREATPAHAGEVVTVCNERLDPGGRDALGRFVEADVTRALNELEAAELVDADRESVSPTGKGRPRYDLSVERDTVVAALEDDDRLGSALERQHGG